MAYNLTDIITGGIFGGFLATLGILFFLLAIAVYIFIALALISMAKKTKTVNSWLAWIPIANFYLVTQMAKKSGWWTLIILAGLIPFWGIITLGVSVWFFWVIAERIKFPGWTSLLLLVPVINLVILGIWAWSK